MHRQGQQKPPTSPRKLNMSWCNGSEYSPIPARALGSGVGPVGKHPVCTGRNVCSQLGNVDSQLSPGPPARLRKKRPFQGEFALPEQPRPSQDEKGRAGKEQP